MDSGRAAGIELGPGLVTRLTLTRAGIRPDDSAALSPSRHHIKLILFGDSICFGQGISLHKGWAPRLSARLGEVASARGGDLVVINSAANGGTTRHALERMPYEVQSQWPELLLVQFGLNDCNRWETDGGHPRVSPAAFKANLAEIVARAFVFGARRVFLNTNHPTMRDERPMPHGDVTYEEANRAYNALIRELAAELGPRVVLNDMFDVFAAVATDRDSRARLVLDDGLHLSERGHDLYFETICPRIEAVLLELFDEAS